ncbi:MAG: hypothetical protein AAGB26_16545 [Planctomycetota bacterium]
MNLKDLKILVDLKKLYPKGAEFRQFQIYPPKRWKSYTSNGQILELKDYFKAWEKTEFILIGGTDYGDAIVVTDSDPLTETGAIYMVGEGFDMDETEDWPESVLRLGIDAAQWHDRIRAYKGEPAITPGSIDEELGDRAATYREQIKELNPAITW